MRWKLMWALIYSAFINEDMQSENVETDNTTFFICSFTYVNIIKYSINNASSERKNGVD